jgi:UDPglucose 6-dehydrogenase
VLALVTEWNEFRSLDLGKLRRALSAPVVVDLRNVWDPTKMRDNGFVYSGLGRGVPAAPVALEA